MTENKEKKGEIVWFNMNKFYGFVKPDDSDGHDLWFHGSFVDGGEEEAKHLTDGVKVSYVPGRHGNANKPCAKEVKRAKD